MWGQSDERCYWPGATGRLALAPVLTGLVSHLGVSVTGEESRGHECSEPEGVLTTLDLGFPVGM